MKCFVCVADGMHVGIPAEKIERIVSAGEAGDAYVSLAQLLALKDASAVHAMVLKPPLGKTLLTPKVENEIEIPEEGIHRLPESLAPLERNFKGACFFDNYVLFILDTEKLLEPLA